MNQSFKKYSAIIGFLTLLVWQNCYSGPPFNTDDPEIVRYKHWEYYISSINNNQPGVWSGTSPHIEFNYGLIPDIQIHLLLPMNYSYIRHQGTDFGYADTEFGIKFRFIKETDKSPQIGTFPLILIPTIKNSEFSNGKTKIFIPIWAQKSWGKLTTYGGTGYWINPGDGNRNWIFTGWEVQYDFSSLITLGGELYFHSADTQNGKSGTGFNIGGSLNPSDKFHIIFSAGHSLSNDKAFNSYFGLLWTI